MQILSKYIYKTVTTYVLLVILLLTGVQIFLEFMHEFSALGVGQYGIWKMMCYVGLMLPYDIYQFFPIACLLGLLLAFGVLAMHSELIIMRVSGVSLSKIIWLIIKISLTLMAIMVFLGEVLSPLAQEKAARLKSAATSGGQVLLTRQGVWLYHQAGITHIDTIMNNENWHGITDYRFTSDSGLEEISYATRGTYKADKWFLHNGVQSNFKKDRVESSSFMEQELPIKFNPQLIGITDLDTQQKTLPALYEYIQYRKLSGYDASLYMYIFWQRIFAPLALSIMLLFVIPFLFGALRGMHLGLKILLGVCMGFIFHILAQFAGSMSVVYEISPIWAAVLPLIFFAFLGSVLIVRMR